MKLYTGHVLDVLAGLPEKSAQCIVTSPPYWGLRKYSGEQEVVWGGKEGCEHEWGEKIEQRKRGSIGDKSSLEGGKDTQNHQGVGIPQGQFCSLCGAWRGALGLEPTPALYIEHSMTVLDALWRVLRDDGVLWWNLGDSYSSSTKGDNRTDAQERPRDANGFHSGSGKRGYTGARKVDSGLKPKDLCLIPFRFALAAQERGWWVRSDIIWSKPNPMPESVTDRPTRSHEYLFLLTKAARYFYDAEAVKEPARATNWHDYTGQGGYEAPGQPLHTGNRQGNGAISGRNLRSVWLFSTTPFEGAHFATFPPELPRRCILASTSPKACPSCGAAWTRIIESRRSFESGSGKAGNLPEGKNGPLLQGGGETVDIRRGPVVHTRTLGWKPTCSCPANDGSGRCVVLDPFSGSGTTVQVAEELNREGWGIDISGEYRELQTRRVAPWQGQRRL